MSISDNLTLFNDLLESFVDGTSQWPIETYVVLGSDQLSTEDLEAVSKIKNLHFISKPEMRVIHDLSVCLYLFSPSPSRLSLCLESMKRRSTNRTSRLWIIIQVHKSLHFFNWIHLSILCSLLNGLRGISIFRCVTY